MGHALNGSVQDALIRYHRMRGRADEVDPRHRPRRHRHADAGREAARARGDAAARRSAARRSSSACGAGASSTARTIIEQFQRLGASCDYEEERFTLDEALRPRGPEGLRRPLREGLHLPRPLHGQLGPGPALGGLRPRGRGARGRRHALLRRLPARRRAAGRSRSPPCGPRRCWPTPRWRCTPATSATARLVGETAILPLVGRRLPIIADDYVKPEFGTGALKITPGHDPNDFEIGRRHGLTEVTVIGEDGRMTEAAGERFAGPDGRGGARGGRRRAARGGAIARTEPYRHVVPYSPPLGRAHRAAHLAAVVHAHGRAGRARRSTPCATGRVRIVPDRYDARLHRVDGEHPPLVHLAPAVVGPPAAGLVPRRETYVGTEPPEGEGWTRDPDVLDTWFSSALWPFATLGWPEDTPELRAFYPTDVLVTARDILFLWVARMIMMGLEFTGDRAVLRRLHHLGHPGARRAADVQVAGHRHRSGGPHRGGPRPPVFEQGGDSRLRRRRGALRPAGDVLQPGRPLQRGEDRAGPAAGQQALERLAARARCAPRDARAPRRCAPRAIEDRWILSRLAAARSRDRRAHRRRTTSPTPRSGSTTSSTASCATGTWRWSSRASTTEGRARRCLRRRAARAARDARARAPDHPVRDRGDLVLLPAPAGCWRRGRSPRRDPALRRRGGRGRGGRPDRRRAGAARLARRGGRGRRRAASRRGWRPRATTAIAEHSRGWRASSGRPTAASRSPRWPSRAGR